MESITKNRQQPDILQEMTEEHDAMRTELAAFRLIQENTCTPIPNVDYAALGVINRELNSISGGGFGGYGRGPLSSSEQIRRGLYTRYLALVQAIKAAYRGHTDHRRVRARLAEVQVAISRLS